MVVVREELRDKATLFVVTEKGRGKRTAIDDYRFQTRGGMGVINFRINDNTGKIVAIKSVQPGDELMLITRHGIVNRQRVSEIRVIGRATQGVRVMALDQGDVLMDVARVVPDEENGLDPVATEQPVAGDGATAAEGPFAADGFMVAADPFADHDDALDEDELADALDDELDDEMLADALDDDALDDDALDDDAPDDDMLDDDLLEEDGRDV
jgi:DNA gyrase subunit A